MSALTDYEAQLAHMILSEEAPLEEPDRQRWFMKKAHMLVEEKSRELGRPMRALVKTFGCQMNERDSEKLRGILESVGYELTEEEDADFVLYNTCTVRENANLKVYGRLGYLGGLKKKNPHMIIGLCGCMMQEAEVVAKIQQSYRFVNLIFGTHNIYKFAELLVSALENDRMIIDIWKDTDKIVEDLPAKRTYNFKSGVNIMFGCNNFCSYCIVPYVRGRERSRRPVDIVREIEKLVQDGVVEVMLLGQNVNSYGKNLDEPMTFAQLLQESRKGGRAGEDPFYDIPPQGSFGRSDSGDEAFQKDLSAPASAASVRQQPDLENHESEIYERTVSGSGVQIAGRDAEFVADDGYYCGLSR